MSAISEDDIVVEDGSMGATATVTFPCGCVACDEQFYPSVKWCDDHGLKIQELKARFTKLQEETRRQW